MMMFVAVVLAISPDSCQAGQLLAASVVLQMPGLQNLCERVLDVLPTPANKCNTPDLQNHVIIFPLFTKCFNFKRRS